MNTPVWDFVRDYAEGNARRLHMPGHKGSRFLGMEMLDITEIPGADVLYHSEGILRESQKNAANLFGAGKTLYSAEGSSLAIRAMLALVKGYAGEKTRIAAGRNAHKVFLLGCGLLDISVDWLYGREDDLLRCNLTPEDVEAYLADQREKPAAVYVTCPDYLGNMVDIRGIARVCHAHGVLLLVDNAHGAYLRFLPESRHPMDLGADLCCDSAHKTLPVLTGGAYLHLSKSAPAAFFDRAESAMALFASTSPSYLILQSLDLANRYLADGCQQRLEAFTRDVAVMKARLTAAGFSLVGDEPLKVSLSTRPWGYSGLEAGEACARRGIVCEFFDPDYLVFMLTPENSPSDLVALEEALLELPEREPLESVRFPVTEPERRLTIRQALLAQRKRLPLTQCLGRVLAEVAVSCPPAIPVAVCGEVLDETALKKMAYYGITHCDVVEQ